MKTTCPPAEIKAIANPVSSFYVYIYLDPGKAGHYCYTNTSFLYEPVYIGKGQGKRCLEHLKSSRGGKKNAFKDKLSKILSNFSEQEVKRYILLIKTGLTECEAFNLEKELISEVGRRDRGKGPLTNLTDGGEGVSGLRHSKETKNQMSKIKKGRKLSEETKKKNIGKGTWQNLGRQESLRGD